MEHYEWVKRSGQQHWTEPNAIETLCGMPMLGNNYADVIKDEDKRPCDDCRIAMIGEVVNSDE